MDPLEHVDMHLSGVTHVTKTVLFGPHDAFGPFSFRVHIPVVRVLASGTGCRLNLTCRSRSAAHGWLSNPKSFNDAVI